MNDHHKEKKQHFVLPSKFFWVGNLILFVIIILVALHWGDWKTFFELLKQINLKWLWVALILQIGTYVCMAIIWKIVLKSCNMHISARHLFEMSIAKLFFDQTLPSFGLSGSMMALRGFIRRESPAGTAAAAVVMNTISRYIPYFVLFNIAVFIIWKNHLLNKGFEYFSIFLSIAIIILAFSVLWSVWLIIHKKTPRLFHRVPVLSWLIQKIEQIPLKVLKDGRLWFISSGINTVIFFLDATTLWVLLYSLAKAFIPFSIPYTGFMVASAVTDFAVVPGKVGVFEGTSITMLHLFKIPIETAVAAIVLFRGLTFWLPMIPGFLITRREFQKN